MFINFISLICLHCCKARFSPKLITLLLHNFLFSLFYTFFFSFSWNYYFFKIFLPFHIKYTFCCEMCVFFRLLSGANFRFSHNFPAIFNCLPDFAQYFFDKIQRFYDDCCCSRLLQNFSRMISLSTKTQLTIINMFSFIAIIFLFYHYDSFV